MSERSLIRAHHRRLAAAARREALRRRRAGLTAGVAVGATMLLAPAAQAAEFQVNTVTDGLADAACGTTADDTCTLRDAVELANDAPGADRVTFASGLTGTIRLTSGGLTASSGGTLTIEGPGATALAVSGDADANGEGNEGDVRVLFVDRGADVELSGLTLTGGYVESNPSASKYGGGAAAVAPGGALLVRDAVLADSVADLGGALYSAGELEVLSSTLRGNEARQAGGAIAKQSLTRIDFRERFASEQRGAARIGPSKYTSPVGALVVRDSVVTGNTAQEGGGIAISTDAPTNGDQLDAPSSITNTTIATNAAALSGAGVSVGNLATGSAVTVSRSAITQNAAAAAGSSEQVTRGGGLFVPGQTDSPVTVLSTTLAGNSADEGGGVSVGDVNLDGGLNRSARAATATGTPKSPLVLEASTVSGNTARTRGGGFDLGRQSSYDSTTETTTVTSPSQPILGTVIAGNTVGDAKGDLGQDTTDSGDGFVLSHSLVQTPGSASVITDDAAPSKLGVDPELGPLADNGGRTSSLLPSATSPLLDAAKAPDGVTIDQRGLARTVDLDVANATGGDGTDIGSVERAAPPKPDEGAVAPDTAVAPLPAPPQAAPTSVMRPVPLSRPKRPVARQPLTLNGRASVGTEKVRVAVARKTRGLRRCRFLRSDGTFSAPRDCRRTSYVTAKGTRTWTLKLPALAKGRYIIWSRALAGDQIERKLTTRNFTRLVIE